jgi:hypothetical protein
VPSDTNPTKRSMTPFDSGRYGVLGRCTICLKVAAAFSSGALSEAKNFHRMSAPNSRMAWTVSSFDLVFVAKMSPMSVPTSRNRSPNLSPLIESPISPVMRWSANSV